jgi:Domain of unknown function (DUF2019)
MTNRQYSDMSDEQLGKAFVEISVKEADAMGLRDSRAVNKLIKQLRAVKEVLRARGPEARKVLVPLLSYPASRSPFADQAAQVRLNAAKELLRWCPSKREQRSSTLPRTAPARRAAMLECACSSCKTASSSRLERGRLRLDMP